MGTLDAHLVAIDAKNGRPLWNVTVGDPKLGYSITMAPLVVKDKVLVGVGGGEYGIRGFIAAYDAKTGKEAWRFYTIPGPGEPGHETWKGDAWKTGGGSIWVTPSYDPALNLTYWGVGNPGPDWNPDQRPGDNLYTDSVVALDADTGAAEVALPVHAERRLRLRLGADRGARRSSPGAARRPRRCCGRTATASSTCSIARPDGSCRASPFVKVNWASGLDDEGPADPDAAAGRRSRRGPAIRAAPTGTRRRSARAPGSSTCRRGKATRRSTGRSQRVRARTQLRRRRHTRADAGARRARPFASAARRRSTTGPTPSATAR